METHNNLSNYSTYRLIKFSLPSILACVLSVGHSLIDTYLVGNRSVLWLASLALATTIISSLEWMSHFLVHSSTQGLSKARATNQNQSMEDSISSTLIFSLLLSLFFLMIFWWGENFLFQAVGVGGKTYTYVQEYYHTRILFFPFHLLTLGLVGILRGLGLVGQAFFITFISFSLNIILSVLFLETPQWGWANLKGVALGTGLSEVIAFFLAFLFIQRSTSFRLKRLKFSILPEFGKHSRDLFLRSLFLTCSFFLATRLAQNQGPSFVAAHQIFLQLWLFLSFFIDGLAVSAHVLISYEVSRGGYKWAQKISLHLIKISVAIGLIFSTLYLFFGKSLIFIFVKDLGVAHILIKYLPLMALISPVSALAFILDGIHFGYEGYNYLRNFMALGLFFIFIPLVCLSLFYSGIFWIWMGMGALNLFRVLSGIYLLRKHFLVYKKV